MEARAPSRIRALIYDFDDTIVESERINDRLFSEFMRREHNIDLSQEELDYLYGFSWSGIFEWLGEHRGLRPSREEVWTRFLEIKREFLRGTTLRVATGLDQMLALPVPQAIVSGSTREEIRMMMDNIHMSADSVDFILCEEDGGAGKPDPEGFLRAIASIGVPAAEALVFEDSPAGIEAARRAGIAVAFIAELASRNNAALADLRFESFLDAWQWVNARIGET
ncbi:MAG: HAD family phosphatase [Spirochaetia bacterium]|jgi:beta-phosphoglucomutase-like phosphatase (HAD superfamily)